MKDLLIKTLKTLNYPVALQGTLDPEKSYPESFITFWTIDTDDDKHYDNEPTSYVWIFQVAFYSSKPKLVNPESVPKKIREALKNVGFIPQGKGHDIPSDEPTHIGWVQEFHYKEENK